MKSRDFDLQPDLFILRSNNKLNLIMPHRTILKNTVCLFVLLTAWMVFPVSKGNAQNPTVQIAVSNPSFCPSFNGVTLYTQTSGGTAPYYHTWWCDTMTINTCNIDSVFDDDPLVRPDTSGWFYVQVIDMNGNPSNIDSVFVTVLPAPVVDAGPDISMCAPNAPCQILSPSISGAPGPYSYLWLPGTGLNDSTIANPCARPDSTIRYGLFAQSSNGCWSALQSGDTLAHTIVTVHPAPLANAGPDIDLCDGDSAQLQGFATGAGPNYFFSWSPGIGLSDPSIPNPVCTPQLDTTCYILTAFSNGCPSLNSDTVKVYRHAYPAVPQIFQSNDTLWSSPGPSYQWCYNGQPIPGATLQYHIPTANGTYSVKHTSNWGCETPSPILLSRDAMQSSAPMLVFPNPVTEGELTIRIPGPGQGQLMSLRLFTLAGKDTGFRITKWIVHAGQPFTFALPETLGTGSYLLEVDLDGRRHTTRLLIQR